MPSTYQMGSIRRVKRSNGSEAWEWRYRQGRGPDQKMKQKTFSTVEFPTEKALRRHLATPLAVLNNGSARIPIAILLETVIDRYEEEYLPKLAKSTQNTDGSMLRVHVRPKWGKTRIQEIKPMVVEAWLGTLKTGDASRGRARRMMKQLIDKAMFWEYIPFGFNPITLIKVRGSKKKFQKTTLFTFKQLNSLLDALEPPFRLMVIMAAALGLRVSEVVAVRWEDIDLKRKTVNIRRAWTHAALKEAKTPSSEAELPLTPDLLAQLKAHKKGNSPWVFPSPRKDKSQPRSGDAILKRHFNPVGKKLKLPHFGWHTFRHSYRAWLGSGKATLTQQKGAMRHGDISTTANIYGNTPVEELRPLLANVAKGIKLKRTPSTE
jgi:integrase